MLYKQVLKSQQAMAVQPSQTSVGAVNILGVCYSKIKPGKEQMR